MNEERKKEPTTKQIYINAFGWILRYFDCRKKFTRIKEKQHVGTRSKWKHIWLHVKFVWKKNYYGVMCTSINRNDYFSLFLSGCCSHCFHLSSFTFVQHMIYILSDSIYRALGNDENTTRKQCVVWKIFTERTIFPKIYF